MRNSRRAILVNSLRSATPEQVIADRDRFMRLMNAAADEIDGLDEYVGQLEYDLVGLQEDMDIMAQ